MSADENLISLEERRRSRGLDTPHSRRAAADKARWLEIWSEAWAYEGKRRGKRLPLTEREAFARRVRALVAQVQESHGARSGKIGEALEKAMLNASDPELVTERGCPARLLASASQARDYRIDRFTSRDPKALRGKLVDWLWITEALAGLLQRDFRREVISLYDQARHIRSAPAGLSKSGIGQDYDAIFASLAAQLRSIATMVAQEHDLAAYYECCDKMHAAWHDGNIIENDGWYSRFNRLEFADGGWLEQDDGSYWDDAAARSPLGPVGELLIHVPLARVSLCLLELADGRIEDHPGPFDWASLELDVHLATRPDVEDPREAGALLLHPFAAVHDGDLGREDRPDRWWRSVPQVAVNVSEAGMKQLSAAIPPPDDQHRERASELARKYAGHFQLLPLSAETCQAWLSFGANRDAPTFDAFFRDHFPSLDVDPRHVVSAPVGTLAGSVQSNLVLADEGGEPQHRIDRLLAADAERKVGTLRRLLASKRQAYTQKLEAAMPHAELPAEAVHARGDTE